MYIALVVYASLYPFADWRDQGLAPWSFLWAPVPRYWSGFDVAINVIGYLPLGALVVLLVLRSAGSVSPVGRAVLCASLLSLLMEGLQSYLPQRVASREDWLLNTAGAALGGLLKLVEDRCCVVALSPDLGRKIDLANPVRVPARHLALLVPGGRLDPDLQARTEHCFRLPGQPPLSLRETIPLVIAWLASTPKPRPDGFLARKRARHAKDSGSNPAS